MASDLLKEFIVANREICFSDMGLVLQQCHFDAAINNVDALFETENIHLPDQLQSASPGRKAEYLAGRICARTALSTYGMNTVQIRSHSDRSPIWPDGFTGSISHKHNMAVAIVSDRHKFLGADLEFMMKPVTAKKISRKIINAAEAQRLAQSPFEFATGFTAVFSAKEALYKAIFPFVKRYLPFHICELTEISEHSLELKIQASLQQELEGPGTFRAHCHWQEDTVTTLIAQNQ